MACTPPQLNPDRDLFGVDAAMIWTAGAGIFFQCPIDGFDELPHRGFRRRQLARLPLLWRLLRRSRRRCSGSRRRARSAEDLAAGDRQISMRCQLQQMKTRARTVFGTAAIAPGHYAELLFAQ
jgi:hypothetical protein